MAIWRQQERPTGRAHSTIRTYSTTEKTRIQSPPQIVKNVAAASLAQLLLRPLDFFWQISFFTGFVYEYSHIVCRIFAKLLPCFCAYVLVLVPTVHIHKGLRIVYRWLAKDGKAHTVPVRTELKRSTMEKIKGLAVWFNIAKFRKRLREPCNSGGRMNALI